MEERNRKIRKQNMKIYSLYRAMSLDLLFYYAIEFLFLTQVKQISSADIVLSKAFYAIFMTILQIPSSIIIDKLGTRRCTILGNLLNSLFILLIMCCENLGMLIFAQLISSLCFSLKNISDRALIQYSIPKTKKKGEIFSKLEGKGYKDYYLLDAVTAICAGFLYVINPYIPIIGALGFTIVSTFMSLGFQELEEDKEREKKNETKDYFTDLVEGVKFIGQSQRLRSLFIYAGLAWGIFCLMTTYQSSLLVDIGAPEQIIPVIAAIVGIASSIGSKRQLQFHNYFRNKSLIVIMSLTTIGILVTGITGVSHLSYKLILAIVTICFVTISFAKGVSGVLATRYLGNFTNEKILTQIYAVNAISENIFRAGIGLIGSYLLRITNTANSIILVGIILLIAVIGLNSYMNTRLGKKPEEYDGSEIFKQKKEEIKNA